MAIIEVFSVYIIRAYWIWFEECDYWSIFCVRNDGMNSQQFVEYGKAILKFVANKNDNIADLNVLTSLKPGYLADLIPCKFV